MKFVLNAADPQDDLVKKIANAIRSNSRALGFAATALKQTQSENSGDSVDDKAGDYSLLGKASDNKFEFKMNESADADARAEAAGIKGEQELFSYLSKLLTQFPSAILIPSITMEDPQAQLDEKGYIGDLDFVLIVGRAILILDSKVLASSNQVPYSIRDSNIVLATKIVREVHPGQYHVKKWARAYGFELSALEEYVIIMSKQETLVYKSPAWYRSPWKLFHVTELNEALHEFYNKYNQDEFHLDLISEMYKCHIKAPKAFKEEARMRSIFKM